VTHKSPYKNQHTPDKDSLFIPGAVKQAMARRMRRSRLLKAAGLDETKQFPTEAQQLAYSKRIEKVLKGAK